VIGRDAETGQLSSLVGGLSDGRPFVLTIRGEPGSGRSSLLGAARDIARDNGARSLVARGVSGATEPAFSGLHSLLRPFERSLDDLAADLAPAVQSALSLGRAQVDPLDVHLGLLRTLTAAAEVQPLVLVLDDADRLDPATLAALSFVLGHLGVDPIGAVAATGPGRGPLDEVTTDVLPLAGLAPAALVEIVQAAVPCAPQVAGAIASWADGSPLLALELARSLTADERDGSVPLPDAPRPTVLVVDRLQRELRGQPADVQRALVVVAADRSGTVAPIVAALASLGEPDGVLDRCEETGIVEIDGDSIRFRHALLRPLAYRLVAAASRRAAHRALASAMSEPHQAAERAWQLVASCAGPDEDVAALLDLLATAERRRGAPGSAAAALEHAARLSTEAAARTTRLTAAALAHVEAGDLEAAERAALDASEGGDPEAKEALRQVTELAAAARGVDEIATTLSAAELRVADAVASGLTNREAAARLYLSAKTIDFHLQAIYRKLAIRSRSELAARFAVRGRS
jgi:DNA-binding NarL/FixJ family response regulator